MVKRHVSKASLAALKRINDYRKKHAKKIDYLPKSFISNGRIDLTKLATGHTYQFRVP